MYNTNGVFATGEVNDGEGNTVLGHMVLLLAQLLHLVLVM